MHVNALGVLLTEPNGILPNGDMICYTDVDGARITIPMTVIIRLYELAKFDIERQGIDFDVWAARLMENAK